MILCSAIIPVQGGIIYVDADAPGANNGQSWADAFTDLQLALTDASAGDEIWVAEGTYTPGTQREVSFELINFVEIYGGFNGTETTRSQRDWASNITILSGEIANLNSTADNSYHVVKVNTPGNSAVLDGFTISNGNANGTFPEEKTGAGILIVGGNATITNCVISDNTATGKGAGMYLSETIGAPFTIENCQFINNATGLTLNGGGLYAQQGKFELKNCVFDDNTGNYAAYIDTDAELTLVDNCIFSSNNRYGLYVDDDVLTIQNSDFTGNTGFGININKGHLELISNCEFMDNTGRGIYSATQGKVTDILNCDFINQGAHGVYTGELGGTVDNCIFDGNAGGMYFSTGEVTVQNCDFENNAYSSHGGAIQSVSGLLTVTNCAFDGNSAQGQGGAIYGKIATLENSNFTGNTAASHGGAIAGPTIAVLDNSTVFNCVFQNNEAVLTGGALSIKGTNSLILNCTFENNTAASWGGGLLLANGSEDVEIQRCKFVGNSGKGFGGGLGLESVTGTKVEQTLFYGNTVSNLNNQAFGGGGIGMGVSTSDISITNCAFSGNTCDAYSNLNRGGGCYVQKATVHSSTFASNIAHTSYGGGVYVSGDPGETEIINCIIRNNTSTIYPTNFGNLYNSITGDDYNTLNGNNVLAVNPFFEDADGLDNKVGTCDDDLRLQNGSPAIDAGLTAGAPAVDLTGFARDSMPDIGSYENPTSNTLPPDPCSNTIVLLADITGATCGNCADGTINLTVSGGVAPYSYSWSNNATTEDIADLLPGDYTVTVTGDDGCTFSETYEVEVIICPSPDLSATPSDESCNNCCDGTIDLNVANGVAPYTFVWSNGETTQNLSGLCDGIFSVTVTDSIGCTATKAIIVGTDPNSGPQLPTEIFACLQDTFWLCISMDTIDNSSGFELDLFYDSLEVYPTGGASVTSNYTGIPNINKTVSDSLGRISFFVYLQGNSSNLTGSGELLCVEFVKRPAATGIAEFSLPFIGISYPPEMGNATYVELPGDTNMVNLYQGTSVFEGQLLHWLNYMPIAYDSSDPDSFAITNIYGSADGCGTLSAPVQPGLDGQFTHVMANGTNIFIERDIPNTANVVSIIGAHDAFLVATAGLNNVQPTTVFEAISMDVDQSGRVTAGDATLILRRSVGNEEEFPRADGATSRDWVFINSTTAVNHPDFINYSLSDVPVIEECLSLNAIGEGPCPAVDPDSHIGVLLGDVDGNWETIDPDGTLRSIINESITIDFAGSIIEDVTFGEFDKLVKLPVIIKSEETVNSMDLVFGFNASSMAFIKAEGLFSDITFAGGIDTLNAQPINRTFNLGAFKIGDGLPTGTASFLLHFYVDCSSYDLDNDISVIVSQLNGHEVDGILTEDVICILGGTKNHLPLSSQIILYPNPGLGHYSVGLVAASSLKIEVFDVLGRTVFQTVLRNTLESQIEQIDVGYLPDGMYWLKIEADGMQGIKKLAKQ